MRLLTLCLFDLVTWTSAAIVHGCPSDSAEMTSDLVVVFMIVLHSLLRVLICSSVMVLSFLGCLNDIRAFLQTLKSAHLHHPTI